MKPFLRKFNSAVEHFAQKLLFDGIKNKLCINQVALSFSTFSLIFKNMR